MIVDAASDIGEGSNSQSCLDNARMLFAKHVCEVCYKSKPLA